MVSAFVAPQANQNLTTMSPYLTFRTGEAWGRFNGALNIQRSENSGQGVLSKSYQRTETVNGGYALDRIWTVTGSIGHEAIFYGGLNPVRINDITWSGGIQVTPSPDSQLMLSYGSKQGRPSLTFNAFTQITARTRLTASYSESLGTQAEDFQNSLATSGINSSGLSVSTLTGAPIGQSNNFNGAQGGVQRTKTASATVSWLRNLEAVSLTFSRVETAQVSNTVAGGPTSTSGINGSVAWQHTFSEVLSSNVFVQVGKRQSGGTIGIGNASQDTLTTYLGVNYIVSETITARMNYSYTSTTTSVAGQSGGQNQVLVGLTKTF